LCDDPFGNYLKLFKAINTCLMGNLVPSMQHVLPHSFIWVVYRQLTAATIAPEKKQKPRLHARYKNVPTAYIKFKTPHHTGKYGDRNTVL